MISLLKQFPNLSKISLSTSILDQRSRLTRGQLGSFAGYLAYAFLAVIIGYLIAFALVKIMRVRPGRKGIFINATQRQHDFHWVTFNIIVQTRV